MRVVWFVQVLLQSAQDRTVTPLLAQRRMVGVVKWFSTAIVILFFLRQIAIASIFYLFFFIKWPIQCLTVHFLRPCSQLQFSSWYCNFQFNFFSKYVRVALFSCHFWLINCIWPMTFRDEDRSSTEFNTVKGHAHWRISSIDWICRSEAGRSFCSLRNGKISVRERSSSPQSSRYAMDWLIHLDFISMT